MSEIVDRLRAFFEKPRRQAGAESKYRSLVKDVTGDREVSHEQVGQILNESGRTFDQFEEDVRGFATYKAAVERRRKLPELRAQERKAAEKAQTTHDRVRAIHEEMQHRIKEYQTEAYQSQEALRELRELIDQVEGNSQRVISQLVDPTIPARIGSLRSDAAKLREEAEDLRLEINRRQSQTDDPVDPQIVPSGDFNLRAHGTGPLMANRTEGYLREIADMERRIAECRRLALDCDREANALAKTMDDPANMVWSTPSPE